MSVPVLLTARDTATNVAVASTQAKPLLLDEQMASCASYMEAATAAATPSFSRNSINEVEKNDDVNLCTPVSQRFVVELNVDLEPNERVGLTGDSRDLGNWQLDSSIALRPQGNKQWAEDVLLKACHSVNYRYFIYAEDKNGQKHVRRWETQLQPRTIKSDNQAIKQEVDQFGETMDGTKYVNRGWLTTESILQLKFEREKMFQVHDVERFDPTNILIKVVPLEEDLKTPLDLGQAGINIEVAKFKYGDSQLRPPPSSGISYGRGDVVIFHVTVPKTLQIPYALIFYTGEEKLAGKAIIKASQLTGSEGDLELSIIGSDEDSEVVVARLTLPYVIVKPFEEVPFDFRSTYAHYWPKSWPNLDVGHRGNGRSYKADPPAECENTVASFQRAFDSKVDMVELDVHLTADGIPVVYHDFGLRTAPKGKKVTSPGQLEYVLIKDITYEALKHLRVFAVINDKVVEYPSHNSEPRLDHRIFPRLMDIFQTLPKSLGIDVEIKWPQRRACGGSEAEQSIDKNFFVDQVISTVIKYGCGRPLIFSSFDADICTMLRFKQNIFPVMFLTMGETKKWAPFLDLRTRSFEQAINNAQAFEFAGTAPHAEDLITENGAQLVQKARNLGQIALVWGDDCNSKERVKYFSDIGATATCYDRADLYIPEGKTRSFFDSASLLTEFESQCRS